MEIFNLALGGIAASFARAIIALLLIVGLLTWFDWRNDFSFKSWIKRTDEPNCPPMWHIGTGIYLGLRFIGVCLLVGMLWGCSESAYAKSFSSKYDHDFNKWSKTYLPGVDWQLLKAQCYQESLLNPDARSHVGAAGLCQFMPGTFSEVAQRLRYSPEASPFAPEISIQSAAFYMAQLRRYWGDADAEINRHSLAMASYNAGAGNIRKAQRRALVYDWYIVLHAWLPSVTGTHAKETQIYVARIWHWYQLMRAGV